MIVGVDEDELIGMLSKIEIGIVVNVHCLLSLKRIGRTAGKNGRSRSG